MNVARLRSVCLYLIVPLLVALVLAMIGCKSGPKLTSIRLSPVSNARVTVGSILQFTATGINSDGSTSDITGKATWTSSATSVATVSSQGVATGVAVGNSVIRAALSGVESSQVNLAVVTLSSISITPSPALELGVNSTQVFTATATYSDGSTEDITSRVTWTSSNPDISAVASSGVARGVAPGTAMITASLSGITSPAVSVPVVSVALASITISPAFPDHLAVGLTRQFTATGAYSDNSTKDITSQVAWTSSDQGIATISASGLATGVGKGMANVTALLKGITSQPAKLPVAALTSITVAPAAIDILAVGQSRQLSATGAYSDGAVAVIVSQVTWASSDNAVVTINNLGLATAAANGTARVTATLAGVTSQPVTVNVATITSIAVTPVSPDPLRANATLQFTATGTFSNGTTADITSKVTWTTSKPQAASITALGTATGVAAGATDITASLVGVKSSPVSLTVIPQ